MKDERTGIPPGQVVTADFPVLHVGEIPRFEPDSWRFVVWGEVENPLEFRWEEFLKLPRRVQRSDFHCVTGW
ncbi:MAG: molybdopterin-dependent oxidoreductase, partial [Dehalococcoidia bacterium]|nr:molybdopterin-dependent oxidoreductase [Dehalococcoidia bacterium]